MLAKMKKSLVVQFAFFKTYLSKAPLPITQILGIRSITIARKMGEKSKRKIIF